MKSYTGKTVEEIHQDCYDDKLLTAKEAIAYGIVDHIME